MAESETCSLMATVARLEDSVAGLGPTVPELVANGPDIPVALPNRLESGQRRLLR